MRLAKLLHPSSLLRVRDSAEQRREVDKFCRELQWARELLDHEKRPAE